MSGKLYILFSDAYMKKNHLDIRSTKLNVCRNGAGYETHELGYLELSEHGGAKEMRSHQWSYVVITAQEE